MRLEDILFSPLPETSQTLSAEDVWTPGSEQRQPTWPKVPLHARSQENATPKQGKITQRGPWNEADAPGGSQDAQCTDPRESAWLDMVSREEGSPEQLGWEGSEDLAEGDEDREEDPPWEARPLQVQLIPYRRKPGDTSYIRV